MIYYKILGWILLVMNVFAFFAFIKSLLKAKRNQDRIGLFVAVSLELMMVVFIIASLILARRI